MCCFALWYCQRIFCNAPDLDLQCWWKTKKININILIAVGAWAPSAPPLGAPLMSGTHNKVQDGNNFNHWKFSDLVVHLNNVSFSNHNPTHLPKHESLSPNHKFSQRIWYVEYYSVHAYMAWSQKYRKSEISLDNGTKYTIKWHESSLIMMSATQTDRVILILYLRIKAITKKPLLPWHLQSLSGKFRYRNQTKHPDPVLILFFLKIIIQIPFFLIRNASILQDIQS